MSAATPADWSYRYRQGNTPWDMGRPMPLLAERLEEDPALGRGEPGRVFVPGCGTGWDAFALQGAGWDVVAVDVSDEAVRQAQRLIPNALVADALSWSGHPFDVIFDHTFFCALAPVDRPRFGHMVDRLLAPDGRLVSVVFPIGRDPSDEGPPYGMTSEDVDTALGEGFVRVETGPEVTIGRRAWPHRLCIWEREIYGLAKSPARRRQAAR